MPGAPVRREPAGRSLEVVTALRGTLRVTGADWSETLEPYATIAEANKSDQIYLYKWQRDLMEHASRIDATDPHDILRPFRVNKTLFDSSAAVMGQPGAVDQPYLVLAQYESPGSV